MLAKELGIDFGYNLSASAVFKAIADSIPAYEGLRYPLLKDESKPAQAKYVIAEKKDLSKETDALRRQVEAMSDETIKITETPKVGHKLHRLTTLTSKTAQFHLLAHGNPKPQNLLVSPLVQFNLDGTPRSDTKAQVAAVGSFDKLEDKETIVEKLSPR
jgi:hypothetical protein